ncbi:hypothetical protein BDR06DRAFT_1011585 [Suillus hirtellus]|nr:hypothetical protein BDR06DRAFT_1011585 [Suillus hirtellus]
MTTLSYRDDSWCALPKHRIPRIFFKALCIVAISKSSVEHWEELRQNPKADNWDTHKKMVLKRYENMNITAGLVLTSSAVFISTNPRNNPISSLRKLSYTLELFSFIAALISLIIGTFVVIIYDPCYAHEDILGSFKKSRTRLICCLVLMASPSLSLVFSTATLMIAIFIAGFTSDKVFVQSLIGATCGTVFFLVLLAICIFKAHLMSAICHPPGATPAEQA